MLKVVKGHDLEAHFYSALELQKKQAAAGMKEKNPLKNLFLTGSYHFGLKKDMRINHGDN